ncbi:hypothetical protein [Anaerocolumna chitinilytica]|uniref:Uncharacterized protein n=1 Tax=Anaerocolumna chitinilytica TaxID=1727145 RepID=A0A7I8DSX1_9FIRM|nr:hypothetical protein [Anaerocolumna chitinilytica]BCK00332.1 hypothetical protein bsdcttw_33720 [Anaerocolumna chitinilytica]
MATLGVFSLIYLLIVLGILGLVIYALILAIMALRIYISKNQNYRQ